MGDFQEAVHHGFSKEEAEQELAERMKRCDDLGCAVCIYRYRGSATCRTIIEMTDRYDKCPYKKEEEHDTV